MRGWTLADSTVDALELPDGLKDFAREMAGKLGAAIYRSREWRALRAACKAAARGLCADCGGFGFECHHRIPLYLGGPLLPDLSGVVWLCRGCHFKHHRSRRRAGWDALLSRLRGGGMASVLL